MHSDTKIHIICNQKRAFIMRKPIISSVFMAVVFVFISTSADAIPAFARKYDAKCSACHLAFPQLNSAGRKFKEAGYAFPKVKGEEAISDFLNWDEYVPLSILVKTRPYDKKNPGDEKLRAIHEVEILSGGRFSENVSGFIELEAEDEDLNERGFEIGVAHAWLTVQQSKALNAQIAWGPMLSADPYDTYSGGRRLTRGAMTVIDNEFGGADDGKLSSPRQSISAYGRPMPSLFYNVGVSGLAGDPEGENFSTYFARVAFDATKNVMVGALMVNGTKEAVGASSDTSFVECTAFATPAPSCVGAGDVAAVTSVSAAEDERDYSRIGIDVQADIGAIRLMAALMSTEDDTGSGGTSVENDASYLHAQYTVKDGGRPLMVGLVRLDDYEENNGADSFSSVTLNLTYYFTQNINGFIEYWDGDGPTAADDKSRITFQGSAAF
jgi:hypothetical protein